MLTESQKRALRAKALLDNGMDAREAARIAGYKNVNGMMGAIALCSKNVQKKEAVFDGSLRSPDPSVRVYPVENGLIKIGGPLGYVTIKPSAGTVHLNVPTTSGGSRWLMLSGRQLGRDRLITALKEIAGAIGEAVSLIEEGTIDVDHHA